MQGLAAACLFALARLAGRLSWRWHARIAGCIAWLWIATNARESRVALRNLELAFPGMAPGQREAMRRHVLRVTMRQLLETLRFWTRPHAENLALVRDDGDGSLFDATIASGRGVIVAAPHYGNWDLLNQWLAARTPLAILYRPPESAVGEAFLQRVRADNRDRVTQVRADAGAVRQLFKRLRDGGVVGILPDQQPKAGDGAFAPFFGVPALTMTLLSRLAARSQARVVFAYCERIDGGPGFRLRIEDAPPAIASDAPEAGVAALNAMV
jgi:KDO2-lipid IV(A) lauroyltransferase